MPHGPTNEQTWCQSGQCSVTIAQFPQRPTIWPCSRSLTRSNSFTGPLLTSSVSSTSNAYTTIAVSSSHSVHSAPSARGRHNWPVLAYPSRKSGPSVAIWTGMGKNKRVRADGHPAHRWEALLQGESRYGLLLAEHEGAAPHDDALRTLASERRKCSVKVLDATNCYALEADTQR